MKYFLPILTLLLGGCFQTVPEKEIIIKNNYVIRTAPEELKRLPTPPQSIDANAITGIDAAQWIKNTEAYILELEAKITILIDFYEKKPTE